MVFHSSRDVDSCPLTELCFYQCAKQEQDVNKTLTVAETIKLCHQEVTSDTKIRHGPVQGTNGTICVHIAVIDRSVEVDLRRIERIVVPGVDRTPFACLLAFSLQVSYGDMNLGVFPYAELGILVKVPCLV